MRIISQKGLCYRDIPYEHSAFYMSTSGNHICANCNGITYSLAEYSTAQKAEKAMQKLHSCYQNGLSNTIFKFPTEEELILDGLHSIGNLDINNPATVSMLEYLSKKAHKANKMTNIEHIRNFDKETLAKFLSEFTACKVCEYYDAEVDTCRADSNFQCVKAYAEGIIGRWLKQPVEE